MIKRMLQGSVVFLFLSLFPASLAGAANWQDRVLPLPQEMEIEGSARVRAGDISYEIRVSEEAPVYRTVRELLDSFALGGGGGKAEISFVLADERPGELPPGISGRLSGAPNAEQAYAVYYDKGEPLKITVAANTPVGLLYGAHTLSQLVKPGPGITANSTVEVPLARITDWPDIAQRGEWLSSLYPAWGWYSQWKLNMFRMSAGVRRGELTIGRGDKSDEFFEWAEEIGYVLIPYIGHIGHWAGRQWQVSPRTAADGSLQDSHGFCWSDDGIHEVLRSYISEMAGHAVETADGIKDIEIWLTESGDITCYCEDCGGENGYVLEAIGVLEVFYEVRGDFPGLRLRIGLSQGSRPVNDEIIELAEKHGAGVTYYDGALTYRTDREPMIVPELEAFAAGGGFADVMPQLSPSYHSLYPGSMPQFVKFRAREFADKNLSSVTAFSQGGPFHYEVNMAAWGEYTWNSRGREPEDFARAYATITGMAEPGIFSRWIAKAGEAAWEFATSAQMFNLAHANFNRIPRIIGDEERQRHGAVRLGRGLELAREALEAAREAENPYMLAESEFTLAGLKSIKLASGAQDLLRTAEGRSAAVDKLDRLDIAGHLAVSGMYEWHGLAMEKREEIKTASGYISPPEMFEGEWWGRWVPEILPWRYRLAGYSILRVSDMQWNSAALFGVADGRNERVPVEIAEWTEEDLGGGRMTITHDLSDMAPGTRYNLGINLVDGGDCQVHYSRVVRIDGTTGEREVTGVDDHWMVLTTHRAENSFSDRLVEVPERGEGDRVVLEILLIDRGGGSTGYVTLRRMWERDEFPAEKLSRLLEG